ncbi:MAG: HlyD family type I secretion periplasmic adaptor subunit [Gammaproteobacteria bacterium]|nr:HlyD family type I secretion periplasmic adaptor subunit [Pseudomonadales bacterium]
MAESNAISLATDLKPQSTGPGFTTDIGLPLKVGLGIVFLVFGVFGVWAAVAPLESAAHAPGLVTVESYKKMVQHLEGGIVQEIVARNGDHVAAGDPLLVLDDTQPLAQLEIANSQLASLAAIEARLIAERDGLEEVRYPESLLSLDLDARQEMNAQNSIFAARKASVDGSIEVLEQRIGQLESRAEGLRALKQTREALAASYLEELEDTRELLDQGFSDKLRLRELERNYASAQGDAADLTANISSTEIQIGETRLEILQQQREFQNQVVSELSEVQTRLKDIRERTVALEDIVRRTVIRAPEEGIVNGMQVHTVGGVINPGTPIAEIVPQSDNLIIESKISPNDIDSVRAGQEASIRFSAFGRGSVPTIYGTVISISADRFEDENSGAPYYLARIAVTPQGMEDLGDLSLVPGMPAEAFINTGSRTFLQYLMKPLTNALARSFREQ